MYTGSDGAGFLSFPDLKVTADPKAPQLSYFYDRAMSKWLPTDRRDVSPDGRFYAYQQDNGEGANTGRLHVVNIATGMDRLIYSGAPYLSPIDFSGEGIYVNANGGLWLVDPATGRHRVLSSTFWADTIANGAAWHPDFNPADPHPAPLDGGLGGLRNPYNRILRFDLSTSEMTTSLYRSGSDMNIMGADYSGNLFVSVAYPNQNHNGSFQLLAVSSPTVAKSLGTFAVGSADDGETVPWPPEYVGAVDGQGAWFDTPNPPAHRSGIWLYTGGAIHEVVEMSDNVNVAGGCIP